MLTFLIIYLSIVIVVANYCQQHTSFDIIAGANWPPIIKALYLYVLTLFWPIILATSLFYLVKEKWDERK